MRRYKEAASHGRYKAGLAELQAEVDRRGAPTMPYVPSSAKGPTEDDTVAC